MVGFVGSEDGPNPSRPLTSDLAGSKTRPDSDRTSESPKTPEFSTFSEFSESESSPGPEVVLIESSLEDGPLFFAIDNFVRF